MEGGTTRSQRIESVHKLLLSQASELEKVTAERDRLEEIVSRVFGATKMQTVSEFVAKSDVERRRLEHERDVALKGYRGMREGLKFISRFFDNGKQTTEAKVAEDLLTSFPEIK